jgi:hypothetical protein
MDPPPARPMLAGKLSFSQFASQPTASQSLSVAMSGCLLTTQRGGVAGPPPPAPPPPPRFGDAPPLPPPSHAFEEGDDFEDDDENEAAADVPLSQMPQATPADAGGFMLG